MIEKAVGGRGGEAHWRAILAQQVDALRGAAAELERLERGLPRHTREIEIRADRVRIEQLRDFVNDQFEPVQNAVMKLNKRLPVEQRLAI